MNTSTIASNQSFLDTLIGTFEKMFNSIITGLPDIAMGLIILIVGFFIATILRKVVEKFLEGIKFNDFLDKVGVGAVSYKIGVKNGVSNLLAKIIFWVILLFIFKNAADLMGIEDISNIINKIVAFLPKVLIATIIMLVGFMVADMVQSVVHKSLDNLGLEYARALAGILFGFIFILVLTVALSQLEIETELLNASVKIILASLGLGLAICLGLGLKRMAGQIVSGVYARDLYKIGTTIIFEGEEAKVAGVGPVTTKLMTKDGGFIMVPNDDLLGTVTRGHSAE
ncbi:MAG: mechanosensitive ion channel family protein [Akkermansiaceae bacterium]